MNIEKQKQTAEEVLHKLEIIDPSCILAGGAPRNWFFDKKCNDLDFYIHIPPNETEWKTKLRFERLGLDLKHVDYKSEAWKQYGVMKDLFRIYEGVYNEQKIQVMIMYNTTFESVIPQFGVSICKFWWKNSKLKATPDSLISILEKTLYIKDDYSAKEVHVQKMKNYFPEFKTECYSNFDTVKEHYFQKYINTDVINFSNSFEDYLKELINNELYKTI